VIRARRDGTIQIPTPKSSPTGELLRLERRTGGIAKNAITRLKQAAESPSSASRVRDISFTFIALLLLLRQIRILVNFQDQLTAVSAMKMSR
jgi:hypothetical protein